MRKADEVKSRGKFRQDVIKIEKSKGYYVKMKPSLVDELDKRYARLGYANRSDLFTAFAYAIIDRLKTKEDDLVFTCAKDLKGNMPPMTEHQIEKHLDELIGSMFKPVIAMRDSDVACKAGTRDILEEYYARYSIFLTEEEVKHAFRRYELMHKSDLREYRMLQMKKRYENSRTAEQPQDFRTEEMPDAEPLPYDAPYEAPYGVSLHTAQTMSVPAETNETSETNETPDSFIRTNGDLPNEMH